MTAHIAPKACEYCGTEHQMAHRGFYLDGLSGYREDYFECVNCGTEATTYWNSDPDVPRKTMTHILQ